MHLCLRGINVAHVFMCYGYRCWSCIYVYGVSMLVMYLCVRGIDVVSCICVRGVLMLVVYLCVRGIDVGDVFVC